MHFAISVYLNMSDLRSNSSAQLHDLMRPTEKISGVGQRRIWLARGQEPKGQSPKKQLSRGHTGITRTVTQTYLNIPQRLSLSQRDWSTETVPLILWTADWAWGGWKTVSTSLTQWWMFMKDVASTWHGSIWHLSLLWLRFCTFCTFVSFKYNKYKEQH